MSPQPKRGVMGSLPRTRPHRRSDKRPQTAPPAGATGAAEASRTEPTETAEPRARAPRATRKPAARKPAAQRGTAKPKARASGTSRPASKTARPARSRPTPPADTSPGAVETAVQAVAELTEIGLHAGARALRRTLSRLSR